MGEISRVLESAGQHGCNGAVVSFGLDTLCQKSADYFRRLEEVKRACERNHLELILSIFSVGYGSSALAHDRNLAEGAPVEDAPFLVHGVETRFVAGHHVQLTNGGFEEFTANKLSGFNLQDHRTGEYRSRVTLWPRGPCGALRTNRPVGSGQALRSLWTGGTDRACQALGSLRTHRCQETPRARRSIRCRIRTERDGNVRRAVVGNRVVYCVCNA